MKSHLTSLCITLAALFASPTSGEEAEFSLSPSYWLPDRVSIPTASFHYGDWGDENSDDFNETNPGLILTWEERALGLNYSLGAYRDSYSDTTVYASASRMWAITPELHGGVVLAYRNSDGAGFTGFAPSLHFTYRNIFIDVSNSIRDGNIYGVIGVGITFPLHPD